MPTNWSSDFLMFASRKIENVKHIIKHNNANKGLNKDETSTVETYKSLQKKVKKKP